MRRSVAAVVVALSTALSITSVSSSTSSAATGPSSTRATSGRRSRPSRRCTALSGSCRAGPPRPEGTMALLDLRLALPRLTGSERRQALGLLARPTDHPDIDHEAYTVPAKKKCAGHICIHWVPTTSDAPPSMRWVNTMLKLMNHVWQLRGRQARLPPAPPRRSPRRRRQVRRLPQGALRPGALRAQRSRSARRPPAGGSTPATSSSTTTSRAASSARSRSRRPASPPPTSSSTPSSSATTSSRTTG